MALAIFDLDNTLLNGDSDYLWGRFLAQQGVVDGEFYERENQRFYNEYRRGSLDIYEFLAFSLKPLSEHSAKQLADMHQTFMQNCILPIITPASRQLISKHQQQGDQLMIITATNRFVTAPIAKELGIPVLLATDPEMEGDRYTGKVEGIPCFQEGKVKRLELWLKNNGKNLANSWFYSDSHNDLPLLEMVANPVVVDPDETLLDHATIRGWKMISLKGETITPFTPS
ncbi:MAG: HAD-IB family hydrolase, partial [Gammaproteobacteria bacterium]|nr:HAD-IB family hydrolase [Gammaproteobacteria bacterium]